MTYRAHPVPTSVLRSIFPSREAEHLGGVLLVDGPRETALAATVVEHLRVGTRRLKQSWRIQTLARRANEGGHQNLLPRKHMQSLSSGKSRRHWGDWRAILQAPPGERMPLGRELFRTVCRLSRKDDDVPRSSRTASELPLGLFARWELRDVVDNPWIVLVDAPDMAACVAAVVRAVRPEGHRIQNVHRVLRARWTEWLRHGGGNSADSTPPQQERAPVVRIPVAGLSQNPYAPWKVRASGPRSVHAQKVACTCWGVW